MSSSEDEAQLSNVLILAPVGVFLGRVTHGIGMVIGQYADKSHTKIRVVLVAGEDWVKVDPGYSEGFVQRVKNDVLRVWKDQEHYDIVCDEVELSLFREEHITGWLLKELLIFFGHKNRRMAFIDVTGGTKVWMLAALDATRFFANVEVYDVKASNLKTPRDYSPVEINDPGLAKLEFNIHAGAAELNAWVSPQNADRRTNNQYFLFKAIYQLALAKASEHSPDALTKVWVDVERDSEMAIYSALLPEEQRVRFTNISDVRKSVSKHLSGIEPYGLFQIRGKRSKSVRLTYRGAILGMELFKEPGQSTQVPQPVSSGTGWR